MERISTLLLASLLLPSTHHRWESKVIIIEKVSERVSASKEVFEEFISLCESESATTHPLTLAEARWESSEIVESLEVALTSTSLFKTFLAVLIVNCFLLCIRQDCICFSNFLESLLGQLLIIWVFILTRKM